jgi:hypothetical protein
MRLAFFPSLLLIAACGSQSPSGSLPGDLDNIQVPAPPAQLCAQSAEALKQLGARGAIDYDDLGGATIPQDIWMGMGDQHNQFALTLALHAACSHPDGRGERKVLIRNESGVVLMEAMIPTNIGLGSLPPE